jgi:hypothetical protein
MDPAHGALAIAASRDDKIAVDAKIAPLIRRLWDSGIDTVP